MNKKSRYEELKQQINFHNYRYHVLDAPVISDLEFDRLLAELRQIEAVHPDWITPDSPTLRTGAQPADRFTKVRHPAPILSLGNAFCAEDARGWYERVSRIDDRVESASFVVEPKIDGLSIVHLSSVPEDFSVVMGRDTLIFAGLLHGAKGAIAATANVVPALVVSIYEKFKQNDLQGSLKAQEALAPLRLAFTWGTFPVVIKEALDLIGLDGGPSRAPVGAMAPAQRERLKNLLIELKMIQ